VVMTNITRLCSTKPIVTVNGLFPGPTIVLVKVVDHVQYYVSIHCTYMLRIINAALNEELFFKIAGHELTVVEVDATYYMIAASTVMDSPIPIDNVTATAALNYLGTLSNAATARTKTRTQNATAVATKFTNSLRSLNSVEYPARVPLTIDHSLFFTIGLGATPCAACHSGFKFIDDINDVSFVMPKVSLLQAHFFNISGVFTDDFPGHSPIVFNYTGTQPTNLQTMNGTKVYWLSFNSTVQLVLQDTGMTTPENHPIHLHGFNFFWSGIHLESLLEVDLPLGLWFMHCHLELHTTWRLKMAFVIDNGKGPDESHLPKC
ncbi:Multicopper oxidase, type 1, partial [Dillenia turbinata]